MKKLYQTLTALLLAGVTAAAGFPVSAAETEPLLPSGKTLDWVRKECENYADVYADDFASAAVGVFQGDKILYTEYFGQINFEENIPADETAVYEWGSISKTLIWVSVMQLWEQGKLDLETDIREYLPEGFFQHLSYDTPITMLNLMNHSAGWQETVRPIECTRESDIQSLGEILREIEPAQIYQPGEACAYSNYGAAVAGYVVECVSGEDFCDYVHTHIFEPLGMAHTALNPSHSDNEWVEAQRKNSSSYTFGMVGRVFQTDNLRFILPYPAGAATGTLDDLMTYGQALVDDTAPLFENPETQALMFEGTDFYADTDIPICAHGFWVSEKAVRLWGHSGATSFGQADLEFDPESKIGAVVMINEPYGNWFLNHFSELVFGVLSPEKYASQEPQKAHIRGNYMMLRSTYRGMLKFVPYLSAFDASVRGELYEIGDGLYCILDSNEHFGAEAELIGKKTNPDGDLVLQSTSMDLIPVHFYLAKLALFAGYVLAALAAVYLLRIRIKLKKHGKTDTYAGARVLFAGQAAWMVSLAALLAVLVCQVQSGGLSAAAGTVLGVLQMLCIAVCLAAAGTAGFFLLKKKAHQLRYLGNFAVNLVVIAAVVYFELYRFWMI